MTKHECKRGKLKWDTKPISDGEGVVFKGRCPICGKEYEQVFSENEGLWDVEAEEYVYI